MKQDLPPPTYVDTPDDLERWAKKLSQATELAVDTEADSFHHYQEKVCLIQITADGEDLIVDPLALPDLEPLRPIFANPKQTKIFHDAGYDLIGLGRDFGFRFAGLFDTMLASRLLGIKSFGLAALLADRYDFPADKRFQRSDWARRPLSKDQIAYARFDTHFLPRLAGELRSELEETGRLAWAQEDFERLPELAARVTTRGPGADPDAWWRLKGVKQLSPADRGRARALFYARDRIAKRLDRPPFKVFGDAVILDLARDPPEELHELAPRKGLRRGGVERFGGQIMRALRNAKPVQGAPPPGTGRRRRSGRFLDPDAKSRYERLRQVRTAKAKELGVDPEVVLANAVLEDLARKPPKDFDELTRMPIFLGWRRAQIGQQILSGLKPRE